MRVVFMGTPAAAVPTLRAVHQSFDVAAVYTRPDKAKGRGLRLEASPVKKVATELGIRVEQPKSLKNDVQTLRDLAPDVILVVAYGAILRPDVLDIPKLGCVNVHFSLLPRWRGAAPVERAIVAGDERTGVATMLMDEGLDTGPILLQEPEEIRPDDTTGTLTSRLAELGAELAVRTLHALEQGKVTPRPQPAEGDTYAAKIEPTDAHLDPSLPADVLARTVRAMNPSPGAYVSFRGKRLKVWRAAVGSDGVVIGDGLRLLEVQPEGKKRMSADEFARGYRPKPEDFA
jgi:methionyl-tRNA formyltransferase